MAERLYNLPQTADLLGTSVHEVRRWIASGRLPAEQAAGEVCVSERGLVRFLTDRGIDLGELLCAVMEPPTAAQASTTTAAPESAEADAARADAEAPPPEDEPEGEASAPRRNVVSRLAEAILHDALRRGADAIYLDPVPGSLTLRLRVGGRVREKPRFASRLPRGLGPLLLARFRAMGHLAESGGHEAAFSVHVGGRAQAFRIEASPTPDGPGLAMYPVASR
jgi:type II secretory ATPase GspE/PulE/Tfp pilus assembly ATPase PilB-like protein